MIHPTLKLKRVYLALRRSVERSVKPFGLTASQFDVVQLLMHEGELEHRNLQEQLAIASPTLTNIVDGMVREGHVTRRADDEDARVKRICLGQKARSLCQTAEFRQAGDALVDRMFKGFTREERTAFLRSLDRMETNLEGP